MVDVEVVQPLFEFLDNAQAVDKVFELAPSAISKRQKRALEEISSHFNTKKRRKGNKASEEADEEDSEIAWDPWKSFKRPGAIKLPRTISDFIETEGTTRDAAASFLRCKFGHDITTAMNRTDVPTSKTFVICYSYAKDVSAETEKTALRYLFVILAWYDMAVKFVKPGASGNHWGKYMKEDLEQSALFGEALREMPDTSNAEALKNVIEWSKQGRRLNHLCEEYGAGCIFFFPDLLTPKFLKKKLTEKGKAWQEVKKHFQNEGLKQRVEQSRCNELGSAIRAIFTNMLAEKFDSTARIGPVTGST